MIVQYLDGIPCRLKAHYDLRFVQQYGRVFAVFDDQDSGNICFGTLQGDQRYHLKFAGAPTIGYPGDPGTAIAHLRRAAATYDALRHENLVRLVSAEEVGGGFAAVFEWRDAICLGKQFPETRERFLSMPARTRQAVFRDVLAFHQHVLRQGYVPVDFYDGSIMYDLEAQRTLICDIDEYRRLPYTNDMGRMYGSSRFMSPEEFELGSPIDEITAVFVMGATAFVLLGGGLNRARDLWTGDSRAYSVALKAVSPERQQRYHTLEQMADAWSTATEPFLMQ